MKNEGRGGGDFSAALHSALRVFAVSALTVSALSDAAGNPRIPSASSLSVAHELFFAGEESPG
jgi:hypothetical protein